MDSSILRRAGLTDSQARGYLALIEYGPLTPADLATHTGETRTNAYAIGDRLVDLGLASKETSAKARYIPQSPVALRQLLIQQQRQLKSTNDELAGLLPALLSRFQLLSHKPGVLYLEGLDALRRVYDDVIRTNQTIYIFSATHDRDDPEVARIIDTQITRQRQAGIKAIVAMNHTAYEQLKNNQDELLQIIPAAIAPLDAQIMIYGQQVAITTFAGGVVTTVVTSPEFAQSMQAIFQALAASDPAAASAEPAVPDIHRHFPPQTD